MVLEANSIAGWRCDSRQQQLSCSKHRVPADTAAQQWHAEAHILQLLLLPPAAVLPHLSGSSGGISEMMSVVPS